MISRSPNRVRFFAAVFAVVLGVQAAWLIGAQMTRQPMPFFPRGEADIQTATAHPATMQTAAWIGWPRGDLWVDYAMSLDAPLIGSIENATDTNSQPASDKAVSITQEAAALAPYDSRVWLMLAAINSQSGLRANKALAQIKMSYYTAPNDVRLMPFRIQVATRSSAITDNELQSFVENELRTIVLRNPGLKPSVALAYHGASPAGRRFLESKLANCKTPNIRFLTAATDCRHAIGAIA
jgi:hypothetical protein